jgi:phosphoglycolate phosphatase
VDAWLDRYFVNIYGGAGLLGKARSLFKLFKREGVDPTTSWYIGDETRDIIGAHAAGLKIISVSWGYNSRQALLDKEPELLVDTPEELTKALKKIWKK